MKGSDSGHGDERRGNYTKIGLTSLSAMVAETTTFPIDLTKTRLQLHRDSRPTSAFRVVAGIVRRQGLLGLYQGLSPAIIRHMLYTPIRIVGYENLRDLVAVDGSFSFASKALVGGISGAIAQVAHSSLLFCNLITVRTVI